MDPKVIEDTYKYGITQGIKRALAVVYETRSGAEMPEDVRAEVEFVDNEALLIRWFRLALTRSADEFMATIRAGAR